MSVADLPKRLPAPWSRATTHPFLSAVRDGTLPTPAFDAWLAQDYRFVRDLMAFQARLLARAPRAAAPVLAGGLVALVEELGWFEQHAGTRTLDLGAAPLPATAAYAALMDELDRAPVPVALAALWAVGRVYLDAWTSALPGAPQYREFVEHWTRPEFAAYVHGLATAADGAVAEAGADADAVESAVGRVLDAEAAFWDMAWTEGSR